MSTSGQTISQLTRDDIINAALRKLVVIGEGQTASASQLTTATQALNALVAEFRTLGMSIWARKTYTLTPVAGTDTYTFGIGQTQNVAYPLRIYLAEVIPGGMSGNFAMTAMSFVDFEQLPDGSTGTPVNYSYQPKVNLGIFTVWPTPDASVPAGTVIRIQYQSPFEYFVAATDTPDFPEEWGNALIYGLASVLGDEMGKPLQEKAWLEKQADKHLSVALSGGTEEASIFFQKEWQER